jgi:hypothetical protein
MPAGFFSRLEENYHVLFTIADLAGGDWPKRARAAAIKLAGQHDMPSLGKRLLAIFYALAVRHGPLLTSKQAEQMVPDEDDDFADYKDRGRPINKYEIRNLLKPFGPAPDVIHPRGKPADRGYDMRWPEFVIAFKHHLGKDPPGGRTAVRN